MPVETVLPSSAITAGFEIGMLLRCARIGSGAGVALAEERGERNDRSGEGTRRLRGPWAPCERNDRNRPGAPGRTLVEFSRAGAASRLAALLGGLGLDAHRDEYAAGGWHRYQVHRVVCTGLPDWPLRRAWQAGYERLCGASGYQSTRQRRHRAELAEAAWRAAVVCGGLRRRGGPLAVRVSDADLGMILVRAARVLDAPVSLRSVAGRHVVEVTTGNAEATLRQLATVAAAS